MDRSLFTQQSRGTGCVGWLLRGDADSHGSNGVIGSAVPIVSDPTTIGLTVEELEALFQVKDGASITPQNQLATFPQSIASGDPRPHGILLWTRLEPALRNAAGGSLVAWQIARTSDFASDSLLLAGVAEPAESRDCTVKFVVEHEVLQSYTEYFYRFLYGGIPSRTGRFKTLPAPDADLSSLRLGYVVCQDYGNGFYTALHHLALEELDYVVHLGDYIYETIAAPSFQKHPVRLVPPFASGGTMPVDANDYRHLYKVYRSDPEQQAVHERFAYIQLWDDHEFANDCHGDFHPDSNPPGVVATTPQPALRQAANQA